MKRLALTAVALLAAGPSLATTLEWADWTSANATTAEGTVGGIGVSFTGALNPFAQTSGGTNYWAANSAIYTPTGTENPPPDSDIIRLIGGAGTGTQTLTFGTAVTNPYMAIMSMGQYGVNVLYDFDAPFSILNQGVGYFGGGAAALSELPGDVLSGNEGHGLIQFQGTFTSISWTIPNPENWHGFQIAIADQTPAIPLPASAVLLLGGLGGLAALRRRRT